jgi:hypothetical protein
MAEVATSVLHNVGNVLNSVNVSATLIVDKIKQFKIIPSLAKASDLLAENAQAPGFLSTDEKGKQIPGYLKSLSGHMANAQETCVKELESLSGKTSSTSRISSRCSRAIRSWPASPRP